MKIIKRLSLLSTIDQRIMAAKPHNTWLQRFLYSFRHERQISVQQELIKHGYTYKPRYNATRLLLAMLAVSTGLFIHLYLTHIYKNQIIARNKYRVEEIEHSSIQLRVRRVLMAFAVWMEKNLFLSEIVMQNKTKRLVTISEAILRTEQYRNYMEKKDKKFEFMDIGILDKYPFPEMKET